MTTDHSRMERLVAVRLGQTDVILEPSGNRPEGVVHHRKRPIAGFHAGRNDPQRRHVVDLVERLLLALHLAPDAVEVLRPATHFATVQASKRQPVVEEGNCDR